jgi:hypothetical protein
MLHHPDLWGPAVPLLKYLVTVGSILFGGLFALSYALGPPSDAPQFVRSTALTAHQQQTTPKQTRSEIAVSPNPLHSSASNTPTDAPPPVPASLEQSPSAPAAIQGPSSGLANSNAFPIRSTARADEVNAEHVPARVEAQAPRSTPKVARKVVRRQNVRPQDVERAYLALREPYAPFYAFGPERPRRVFRSF